MISNKTRGTADHNCISVNYRLKGNAASRMEVKGRDRRNFSSEELKRRMALQDWSEVFSSDNVDVATHHFETKFLKILEDIAPMRKFQPRGTRSDWISTDTKMIMKNRDSAKDRAVEDNIPAGWTEYRRLKNLCNKMVKKDRNKNLKDHYQRLQDNNDAKGLFKLTRKKMGIKQKGSPELFVINGEKITNPKKMSNIQIEAFHKKVSDLIHNLPPQLNDPLKTLRLAFQRWGKSDSINKLILQPVTPLQVLSIIKDLNTSQAFGHEGIDTESLKITAESIAAPIADIMNKSISRKKFPSRWKFGRLIPLYKGANKDIFDPVSFRPISMLPAVSKIMEKYVQSQLVHHMDFHNFWHGSLHSYRRNHSSTSALAQVTDSAIVASEEKKVSTAIAVDESAAFDTVNHSILINKLELYGIHKETLQWIRDYLSARTEYVTIGGQDSNMRKTTTGVPQGSILGPTLFNVYINEFAEIVKDHKSCKNAVHDPGTKLFGSNCTECGNLTTFADDAVFITSDKNRTKNQERCQLILEKMMTFLNDNRMSVNPTKTIM